MTTWPILSVVTFLPTFGALLIYIIRGDDEATQRNSRWIALWTTLITLAVSLILVELFMLVVVLRNALPAAHDTLGGWIRAIAKPPIFLASVAALRVRARES